MAHGTYTIRHWLPILTYCPVNNLPDLLYVSLTFDFNNFKELYGVRKKIKQIVSYRKMYMEDVASLVAQHFPDAKEISVRLLFNRHEIKIKQ